ncbi:MAG: NUDIX domain-containing protein [Chloroflexota bacterium]
MTRRIRYQGAVIQDHHILLIKNCQHEDQLEYWSMPGGGREEGESEEECVARELKEETHLDVQVKQLLQDESSPPESFYEWFKTYECKPIGGEARPGSEPEFDLAPHKFGYEIVEVDWFDLRNESTWTAELLNSTITHATMKKVSQVLGYIE